MITLSGALLCLAMNVYHEARGESLAGQIAVAEVTLNRAKTEVDVCEVISERRQFSWADALPRKAGFVVAKVPRRSREWNVAVGVAKASLARRKLGMKPLITATHYHASYVKPSWRSKMVFVAKIGAHLFYQERPQKSAYNALTL